MSQKFRLLYLLLLAPLCLPAEVKLFENGRTLAEIILPADSPWLLKFAAQELQTYLQQLTGAEFPLLEKKRRRPAYLSR